MKYCDCEESAFVPGFLDPGDLDDLDECPYCCRPLKEAPREWLEGVKRIQYCDCEMANGFPCDMRNLKKCPYCLQPLEER
jgi:hypothetical protein